MNVALPVASWKVRIGWLDGPALAAFGLPFLVYLLTLAPTIYNLDSAELTTAAATGGITRATGYPLYLVLGFLWSHLPLGDVGYRMNLLSALAGALTLALGERLLRRLGVGAFARLSALGLLAFSKFFWSQALIAEVYTLQTALMAGLLLALLRWPEKPDFKRLALVGLGIGLGLSHHMATVLMLPGIAFYLLASHPRRVLSWKAFLAAGGGAALGLSFYLYLPLRSLAHPAFDYAGLYDASGIFHPVNLASLAGLEWLVTGRSFAGAMFAYPLAAAWGEFLHFCGSLTGAFFAIGVGPGLLGLWVVFKRNWKAGGLLLLLFLGHVIFFVNYQVADKELMFLPAYLVWAVWMGVGFQEILGWAGELHPAQLRSWQGWREGWGRLLLSAILVGAVGFALAWNWPLVSLSGDTSTRKQGETILAQAAPGSLVFGYWEVVPVLQYLQLVEGQRPDVQAINRFLIPPDAMEKLIEQEIGSRSIYVDSVPTGLPEDIEALPVGPLYRLQVSSQQARP